MILNVIPSPSPPSPNSPTSPSKHKGTNSIMWFTCRTHSYGVNPSYTFFFGKTTRRCSYHLAPVMYGDLFKFRWFVAIMGRLNHQSTTHVWSRPRKVAPIQWARGHARLIFVSSDQRVATTEREDMYAANFWRHSATWWHWWHWPIKMLTWRQVLWNRARYIIGKILQALRSWKSLAELVGLSRSTVHVATNNRQCWPQHQHLLLLLT